MNHPKLAHDLDDGAILGALTRQLRGGDFDVTVVGLAEETGIAPGRVVASLDRAYRDGTIRPHRTGIEVSGLLYFHTEVAP